jgi:hypothetical protein
MSIAPRVQLVFGPARIDVEASLVERRGGLRAFAREAEQQLGMIPNTYAFYDSFGKVDTPAALQRAVGAARGVCQLEIRENTEGKITREMHAAIKSLEERMSAKMEEAVASVRRDLEPTVKSVADEQISLRVKIDGMLDEALAVRTDALAVEDELNKRIDSLAQDCLAMRADSLTGEDELTARLDALTEKCPIKACEHLEEQLQAELEAQASRDFDFDAAAENLDQILADVRSLEQRQECEPVLQDATEKTATHHRKQEALESVKAPKSQWSLPWETIVKSNLGGVPFSSKVAIFDKKLQACAPFAHGSETSPMNIARFHCEGLRGIRPSRSTPILAPLR